LAAPAVRAQEAPAPGPTAGADSCIGKARLRGLGFEQNGSVLDLGDTVILDLVAEVIRERCAGRTVVIEGHTDVWGAAEYNRKLSERRAESVRRYLVERGVPAEQLRVEGFGEDQPLTTDPSREAQVLNRRVTLRVEPTGR
jgi:outer membrane protein OmpA-like peptidoglycan-associated protein